MRYNKLERLISVFLSKFPFVKKMIKRVYQKFTFFRNKKEYNFQSKYAIKKYASLESETFFGYYDKSPVNRSNKFVIFHEAEMTSTEKKPSRLTKINIVLFDVINNRIIKKFTTSAYNWQQGSKLMWLDDKKFIFNDFLNGNYVSRIINVETFIEKIIKTPIYEAKSNIAFGLSYEKLLKIRPDYGYRCHDISISNQDDQCIYSVDLETGHKKEIIYLHELNSYGENIIEREWVNHIMLSPDEQKIMFLHRWEINKVKFDALYVVDVNGDNLQCLSNHEMVSHCYWVDNETVIGYLRSEDKIDGYYFVNILTQKNKLVSNKLMGFGDGHPSIYKNKILFDTYPNKSRMKELFLFDINSDKLEKIGEFMESFRFYGETRCDLHPRFSIDGKKVFIDSVHEGKRGFYEIDLDKKNDRS